ncbi:copine domain-containing protein [Ditylenchus destructor]|nr:copine domain-containing protein [Ditylenchus destructor]
MVVTALLEDGQGFTEIGQTETVTDRVNPSFERTVPIAVRMDISQQLKLILYRVDAETEAFIERFGDAEVNLFALLTNPTGVPLPLISPHMPDTPHSPFIVVAADAPESSYRGTVLAFAGNNLGPPRAGYQTAPYFILELISNVPGKAPVLLYRSELAHNCENAKWREFTLPTNFFPTSADWLVQISCYNFNNNADDTLLGQFTTTFYQLLDVHNSNKFLLRNGPKRKENATIELVHVRSKEDIPSFVNMLKSGLQMHCTIAIDFTANNGGPNNVNSLHYIHPHGSNPYMSALGTIATPLMKFDKLSRISALGFGAKVPPTFEMSQLFALNGDVNNPHVKGVAEVLHYYRNNAISLQAYAPTEYSGVIHHVIKLAKASIRASANFYFTLVILTNGAIKDIRDTVDTIVQASELPISIVFVALGNAHNPIGSSNGDLSKLLQLLSPSLKSSRNIPLKREVVSLVVNTP